MTPLLLHPDLSLFLPLSTLTITYTVCLSKRTDSTVDPSLDIRYSLDNPGWSYGPVPHRPRLGDSPSDEPPRLLVVLRVHQPTSVPFPPSLLQSLHLTVLVNED